jgi:hypothetical protein
MAGKKIWRETLERCTRARIELNPQSSLPFTMSADEGPIAPAYIIMSNRIHTTTTTSSAKSMTMTCLFFYFAATYYCCCIVGVNSFSPAVQLRSSSPSSVVHHEKDAGIATTTAASAYAHHRQRSRRGIHTSPSTLFLVGLHHPRWNPFNTGLFVASTSSSSPPSSPSSESSEYPPASDGEAIQILFAKHCDSDGLMAEDQLRNVPAIRDMLVSH